MFLKRLEMKGFKSFADKVVINLEPGISAIVGPNGSGKSNICDAILWVLGERNAKSLRGAVMEDVIFAGSLKRSAVSVAEVTLVLDNTDGVLPIEYNEVSVSRRLYRSGESEYLINGVISRRLDVLDILHDSGIGTDTNSIISQGHLDSILQSKPQDRRTLIEEAAGVLKHKQRKIRSKHKLERMQHNLERIGDVMAEIERQLKPLRIKAKRAMAYDGLVDELSALTLEIAVDDLKKIKSKWDDSEKNRIEIQKSVDEKKRDCEIKDAALSELRSKIATQNSDIVEYSGKQRKLNSFIERLQSSSMLLKQKAVLAQDKYNDLCASNSENGNISPEKKHILDEITSTQDRKNLLTNQLSELQGQKEIAKNVSEKAKDELEKFENEYNSKSSDLKQLKNEIEDYNVMLTIADSIKSCEDKKNDLDAIKEKIEISKEEIKKLNNDRDIKNNNFSELISQQNEVKSSILALEKILQNSYEKSSKANKWLHNSKSKFNNIKNLSDEIDVPDKYLTLVESILGNYLSSFLADIDNVKKIKNEISNVKNINGKLRFMLDSKNKFNEKLVLDAKNFASKNNGIALCDEIKLSGKSIFGVLSYVVVFEKCDSVFKLADKANGLCLASLDGAVAFPDGRMFIRESFNKDQSSDDNSGSILGYKKDLSKLKTKLIELNVKIDNCKIDTKSIEEKIFHKQDEQNKLNNKYAIIKAEFDFAENQLRELKNSLNDGKKANDIDASKINFYKEKLSKITEDIKNFNEWIGNSSDQLNELRELSEQKKSEFNSYALREVALKERIKSQINMLNTLDKRLQLLEENEQKSINEIKASKIISDKCSLFVMVLDGIARCAKSQLKKLDDDFSNVNEAVKTIQKQSDNAIEASNNARKLYDLENQKLSQIQVELGRLEVQVQNAVDTINNIDGISVDRALEMPDIENRQEKEERQFKLRRRIANMGAIDPEAKEEYETLKERFDFLNGQVEDLTAAKISLAKIDNIIEQRMKDDFVNTFNEVNQNFQDIFAVLFPGGKARLELEVPNDVENSGVEVKAQPHGKSISKMSLLSGGEKSLVALCLLFAVYKKRSTPFYILDEVEAALDDTNLRRLIKYLEDLKYNTQLIMITHQRRTMEMANILYGVSMKNDGITRVVSQRLDKDNRLRDIDK